MVENCTRGPLPILHKRSRTCIYMNVSGVWGRRLSEESQCNKRQDNIFNGEHSREHGRSKCWNGQCSPSSREYGEALKQKFPKNSHTQLVMKKQYQSNIIHFM